MGAPWGLHEARMGLHGAPAGPAWALGALGPGGCREAADKFVRRGVWEWRSPPRRSSLGFLSFYVSVTVWPGTLDWPSRSHGASLRQL